MKTALLACALVAVTATCATADIQGFATGLSRDIDDVSVWTVAGGPPQNFQGDYYTTSNNCTYRRAQAPGYAPNWILVLNPHHIGRPSAHRGCPGML